jgi:gliding motility-associated-like protein
VKISFQKDKILALVLFALTFTQVKAQVSVAGTISGIPITPLCAHSSGIIQLNNYVGTIQKWESSTDSNLWTPTGNTDYRQNYIQLTQTTYYRAFVKNGSSATVMSNVAKIRIYKPTVGGTASGGGTFCTGAGVLQLSGYVGNILYWLSSTNGGTVWDTSTTTIDHYSYSDITQSTLFKADVSSGNCDTLSSSQTQVSISPSKGGITSIHPHSGGIIIGDTTCCGISDSGKIKLNNHIGSILRWQSSLNGGLSWDSIPVTADSLIYSKIKISTIFKAVVQLGICHSDTSTRSRFILKNSIAGKILNADTTVDYKNNSGTLQLSGYTGNIVWESSTGSKGSVWNSNSNTTSSQSYENLIDTTKYRVVVKNDICPKDTSNVVSINVPAKSIGKVVNVFTPNGDGINDTFFIKGLNNYDDNEVSIYNIYGNLVFNQKAYKNDWKGTYNGSDLPDGTYYYVVKFSTSEKPIKGSVDILRGK